MGPLAPVERPAAAFGDAVEAADGEHFLGDGVSEGPLDPSHMLVDNAAAPPEPDRAVPNGGQFPRAETSLAVFRKNWGE